jgi:hypothetical protein
MAAEPFIPISRKLYQSLVKKYGGGPEICALELCSKCQTYIRAYNERKQAEFDLVSKYDTKDTGDGNYWYLVDALWVNKWKRYVRGDHVTDIADVSAPGAIANERLFDKDTPGVPRKGLRLRIDYIGVNARVWWLFMHVHGGGPSICREELDIYSKECSPEVELRLEELRDEGSTEYSRRISHEFVDECHGDLAIYNQKYDQAVDAEGPGDPMQVDSDAREPGAETTKRKDELEQRVQMLTSEVEELRRTTSLQMPQQESQLNVARSEVWNSQTSQKESKDAGASGSMLKVPQERDGPEGAPSTP